MIAIIDYNAGNLKSVEKALHFLGEDCVITRNFHEIETADKVIRRCDGTIEKIRAGQGDSSGDSGK